MTKWSGLKKAVMAMMAVGMLCACGNNAQPENGVTAKLNHADGTFEYVHIQGMEDYLDCIFAE